MTETWALAALWLGLALVTGLASIWLRATSALLEIMVGMGVGAALGTVAIGADQEWVKFLAGAGAMVLTFLAGAEVEPEAFRRKWKEATAVGLVSFLAPFLGCAAAARWLLGWDPAASLLAGVAMSTTSVAVVYAVMSSSASIRPITAGPCSRRASSPISARWWHWACCLRHSR